MIGRQPAFDFTAEEAERLCGKIKNITNHESLSEPRIERKVQSPALLREDAACNVDARDAIQQREAHASAR